MNLLWLPLTLTCAFALATSDAFTKKALGNGHDLFVIGWVRLAVAVPILWGLALSSPFPAVGLDYLKTIAVALPLEIAGFILYMKALQASPLSLTLPFQALTPVFLLVVPRLILGEKISPGGSAGIGLIAFGIYTLQIGSFREGIFAPLRAVFRERGSRYMIIVAFIYSITATLGKKAILASSPYFFGATYFTLLVIAMAPFALRSGLPKALQSVRGGVLPGVFAGIEVTLHLLAITLVPVAYMISVKRLSLIVGVLYGHYLFGETGFRERIIGTSLMVAGMMVIALQQ